MIKVLLPIIKSPRYQYSRQILTFVYRHFCFNLVQGDAENMFLFMEKEDTENTKNMFLFMEKKRYWEYVFYLWKNYQQHPYYLSDIQEQGFQNLKTSIRDFGSVD